LSSFRTRGRDARRISDVKQAQNGLEIYYAKETKYPVVTYSGASNSWNTVTSAIVGGGLGITQLSQDPLGDEHSYSYASNPEDGSNPQSYVIGVTLEDTGNQALKSDLDGTIFGIDCADPVYCVQF
jgi:hypothetical protein